VLRRPLLGHISIGAQSAVFIRRLRRFPQMAEGEDTVRLAPAGRRPARDDERGGAQMSRRCDCGTRLICEPPHSSLAALRAAREPDHSSA
jgi:hypothetical protein